MRLDLAALLRDAVAAWRADSAVLFPLAGTTMFLPPLAARLLLPEPPARPDGELTPEAMRVLLEQVAAWIGSYGVWHLAAAAIGSLGALVIAAIYLDRTRPALGPAFVTALGVFPRYLLAYALVLLAAFAVGAPVIGLVALVVPASLAGFFVFVPFFYLSGRIMLIGPALVAERPLGAIAAIGRSWRLTRGNGWALAWLTAMAALTGWLVASVLLMIGDLAGTGRMANPVIVAIVSVLAVSALAAVALAMALVGIAAYRRLASSGT